MERKYTSCRALTGHATSDVALSHASRAIRQLAQGDRIAICGAGPAGLTAAYLLAHRGYRLRVLESDLQVGGLARTATYKGFHFDIGGHRFFTKIPEVQALWDEVLGAELIDVPRLSRIHYHGKFFQYPLKAGDALLGLGPWQTVLILLSYLRARIHPHPVEENFEQWVSNRFGDRLYRIFFKSYTEKVWGVPCTEVRAEWAAQRIQGLSLARAVLAATSIQSGSRVRTLIDRFKYPRLGPGQMWERCTELVTGLGGAVQLGHEVIGFDLVDGSVVAAQVRTPGGTQRVEADHFISTMPLRSLVRALGNAVPAAVQQAGAALTYRDFIVVALILDRSELFPDNWIYVHTPGLKVGRVQNFNNWSAALVPEPGTTCLGMEYFCFEGDALWQRTDGDLVSLATHELGQLRLAPSARVLDATVVRMPKAYPIYDRAYRTHLDTIRPFLDAIPNLHTIGRGGMHKYNNQDHSMYAAMLLVENLEGAAHDLWAVNSDLEYQEEQRLGAGPAVAVAPRVSPPDAGTALVSVIVPVRDGADLLPASLAALRASEPPAGGWELIVVDDSSRDGSAEIAARWADRVIPLNSPSRGPAYARNRGAEAAKGTILAFIDADVCVHQDALRRMSEALVREPGVSAVFGAYDLAPQAQGLISQYRNLLHRYIHQRDAGDSVTFWAGCGAMRADIFADFGGFDESMATPSVEDIELGYRLSAAGHRIVLRPEIQGGHLKRWTLRGMIVTDVWHRGVPWLRLLQRAGPKPRATLNLRPTEQACTALAAFTILGLITWLWSGATVWLEAAAAGMVVMLALNGPLIAWFAQQRGWWFAIRTLPLRLLYYALNVVSVSLALLPLSGGGNGAHRRGRP
jgi:protoporphyrinogen oxidase/GT2 family glycosyltransferase